jgi:hypothetical protein
MRSDMTAPDQRVRDPLTLAVAILSLAAQVGAWGGKMETRMDTLE